MLPRALRVPAIFAALCTLGFSLSAGATTVDKDLASYAHFCPAPKPTPICIESIQHAVADARGSLHADPTLTYNLHIPAGVFDLSAETKRTNPVAAVIDVAGISPTSGSLNIIGAGMKDTVLITTNTLDTISGFGVSHIHFSDITFRRDSMTVTQGLVGDIPPGAKGSISFTVPPGFPTPLDVYHVDTHKNAGGFLRAYTNAPVPQLISVAGNEQIGWTATPTVSGSTWTIAFKNPNLAVPAVYAHAVVCIKSSGPRPAYIFDDLASGTGTDVGFTNVTWYDMARGAWRNIDHPYVKHSYILPRDPIHGQGQCMSTPSGGPQFGQPDDYNFPLRYALVDGLYADRTGDDSIAFFHAGPTDTTSLIENSTVIGSFARDINLHDSCSVRVPMPQDPGHPANANHVSDCIPEGSRDARPAYYHGCVSDTTGFVRHDAKPTTVCVPFYNRVPPL